MKKLILLLLFIPLLSFGQTKSLEDYKNLIDESYRTKPRLAIETFEKALINYPDFSKSFRFENYVKKINTAYLVLIAAAKSIDIIDEKLKQDVLKLIAHLDKWKVWTNRGLAYKELGRIYYSEGLIKKSCQAFLVAKEMGKDFSDEENKAISNACKDIVLEESLEKSKLYFEIYKKAENDKLNDKDLTGLLNLSIAYNKNNFESLAGLSGYLIRKQEDLGKNTVEKIKSINQRLINNINSEEFQSMGNFLNGNLYMAIISKEWEKLEKEGLTKADIRKQIKESDEYKSSIFFFNEAIKITPNDIGSIYTKAMLETGVEDYENACKSFKAIKEILEKQGTKTGDNLYDSIIVNINNTCN